MKIVDFSLENGAEVQDTLEALQTSTVYDASERIRIDRTIRDLNGCPSAGDARQMVALLLDLRMDVDTVVAGGHFFPIEQGEMPLDAVSQGEARKLIDALFRLPPDGSVVISETPVLGKHVDSEVANVRHLIVNLIDDPRVAVIKLVERIVSLLNAYRRVDVDRQRVAQEVLDIYSPLASRLGIPQIKWVLEDLAFRVLQENLYRAIAGRLKERRQVREQNVNAIADDLQWRLGQSGIDAQVSGRAKHIYGIWLKMLKKRIRFNDVYDTDAVRVLVETVPDCYAVLGVVHTSWPHIRSEFDDYIAAPKENGYQSIHTTVIGPRGRTLEVQIRTHEMHEQSEMGVCAHWAYKGDDKDALRSRKVDWFRQVLLWRDQLQSGGDPIGFVQHEESPDRIYVTTPRGHVVDLVANATPVDFAYRVHTEIGHRCVSAKVNGEVAALDTPLQTGQVVEVITSDREQPRREWLEASRGFVRTSKAREQIRNWFRNQNEKSAIEAGKSLLTEVFGRLHLVYDLAQIARERGFQSEDRLLYAVGVGDQAIDDLVEVASASMTLPEETRRDGELEADVFPLTLEIKADDRQGLLMDIAATLNSYSVNVVSMNLAAPSEGQSADFQIKVEVEGMLQLSQVIAKMQQIPDVHEVWRAE